MSHENCLLSCRSNTATNGLGLGEEGELKVQMLNKPQMLIEVQMLNVALQPLFRQTLVSCSAFFISCISFLIFLFRFHKLFLL